MRHDEYVIMDNERFPAPPQTLMLFSCQEKIEMSTQAIKNLFLQRDSPQDDC